MATSSRAIPAPLLVGPVDQGRPLSDEDFACAEFEEPRRYERPDRVPETVVEVLSPGAESYERDAVEKRAEYHGLGVLEYVLVDYERRRVSVLTQAPDDYQERVLTAGDTYETALLPGLAIPLDQILPPAA